MPDGELNIIISHGINAFLSGMQRALPEASLNMGHGINLFVSHEQALSTADRLPYRAG